MAAGGSGARDCRPHRSGFAEQITLELSNIGRIAVQRDPGMRIPQVVMEQLSSPVESPYGSARGSAYHGQTGPQASRLRLDE
jgi:dCTP deaminase